MTEFKGRPRLSLAISMEQHIDLQNLLPWGVKNKIYRNITDDLIRILKSKHRDTFIAGILSRDIHLEDFNPEVRRAEEKEKNSPAVENALYNLKEKKLAKDFKERNNG